MAERAGIAVRAPGMLTTVQDLGRPGRARFGVAPGGALDRAALLLGNRLLGNEPGAAALEITLVGPMLVFEGEAVFALTGAELGARLDGAAVPVWEPVRARNGSELTFAPAGGRGVRCYLCVAGGIDTEPVLGSRSTDLIGRFGGVKGRALRAGDRLPVGESVLPTEATLRRRLTELPPQAGDGATVRVVLGPQADRFTDEGVRTFLERAYRVSPNSNRQGVRLTGPPIAHARGADVVSEGIAHGAIQVPGDGQPIVLLAARQTVGGYTKIATAIGADLDLFAQLRPGDEVRFAAVDVAEARRATLERRRWLEGIGITDAGCGVDAGEIGRLAGNWDPDGVVRVLEALERIGATDFRLEVEGAGLRLDVRRGNAPSGEPASLEPARKEPSPDVVTAPVLGVCYRRATPDGPVLAEEGQRVEAGQPICVIEVMKTYHEVTAPRTGTLTRFLVPDGQYVEYGQPIAELA